MHIYLMRHGEAELTHQNDRGRRLTEHGVHQAEKSGLWLNKTVSPSKSGFDCAIVSPYRRAEQTFEQVNKHAHVKTVLSSSDFVPSGNVNIAQDFVDYLCKENPDYTAMLIVSHMPFISYFLDQITGLPMSKIFATASVVQVDYDVEQGKGKLVTEYMPD